MAHHENAREKKLSNLVSLFPKGREKRPLSEALQHRIFHPFDLPSRVNRTLRLATRVIDERMKSRCLHRYLRLFAIFFKHFASPAQSRSIIHRVSPAVL